MQTPQEKLFDAQRELLDATCDLVSLMVSRTEALERRVYKLEDVVREVLQRTAGFGQLVETMPLMDGTKGTERVWETEAKGEDVLGASVALGASERPNSGGDAN